MANKAFVGTGNSFPELVNIPSNTGTTFTRSKITTITATTATMIG